MKYFFIILVSYLLCSCSAQFKPNTLPNAEVNMPYYQKVKIYHNYSSAGPIAYNHLHINTDFPDDMDISITLSPSEANTLIIQGKPKYEGNYKIEINGVFMGSGGHEFNKDYGFIVR